MSIPVFARSPTARIVSRAACCNRLRPELLRRIEKTLRCQFGPPQLPATRGTCLALFAQQPAERWPLLQDALALPLVWRRSVNPPERLPGKLIALAEQITEELDLPNWSLDVHAELAGKLPDLCLLDGLDELIEVDSAWAPLAAGLVVAQGGRPDPAVWATGAWSKTEGVKPVELLDAKLELAGQFNARVFFVPASQKEEAERLAPGNLAVGTLRQGTTDPRQALHNLLADLDVPPGRGEPPEVRAAWFLRQLDDRRARDYYRHNLLPEIAERLRCRITDERFASADELVEQCPRCVARFVAGVPADQVVPDFTPGTKDMTIALLMGAKPENRLIYLRHKRQGAKPIPFTEKLVTWTASEPLNSPRTSEPTAEDGEVESS